MNLLDKIKHLFSSEINTDIINISDVITIPDRDYYKNNPDIINLIDYYKETYLNLLSTKKIISTRELKLDNLEENMLMHVDLLLHNIISEDYFLNLASEELMIQTLKFKLYLNEINELKNMTIVRLIALKELNESDLIPHKNMICLKDEINNLTNHLVIFLGQINAIKKELDTYFTIISINNTDTDYELLNQRYRKLLFISSSTSANDLTDIPDNLISKIAIIEKRLEIYAYQNKDEVKILTEQLNTLSTTFKDKHDKYKLLNQIAYLERKYLLFYEYGRNIVTDEQMQKLYKVKFTILTHDIDTLRISPIKKDDYGYDCYKDIVSKKLETILLGNNPNFNNTFKSNSQEALNEMCNYYKGDFGGYDPNYVLYNKYMLNLLLCFDHEDGFRKMLTNNILYTDSIDTDNENKNEFERLFSKISGITWTSQVSLYSLLSILDTGDCYHPINKLHKLMKLNESKEEFYKLPEGIVSIDENILSSRIARYIREQADNKMLIMPNTLKRISGNLFNDNTDKIILNNGLEYIGKYAFYNFTGRHISIPSSISHIDKYGISDPYLDYINFEDYQNSKLLNNKEELEIFLKNLFYFKPTGNREYHCVDEETKKMQEAYWRGHVSYFANSALYDRDEWLYEYMIAPRFNTLYFDNNIYIDHSELIEKRIIEESYHENAKIFNESLGFSLYNIIDKIYQLLEEKSKSKYTRKVNKLSKK